MQTSQNLAQALQQLRLEIAKQTGELNTKSIELKKLETEKQTLEKEITAKEKQKEDERRKLEAEILQMKNKLPELDRNHRRIAEELTKIRLEKQKNNLELLKIQRESNDAMKIR